MFYVIKRLPKAEKTSNNNRLPPTNTIKKQHRDYKKQKPQKQNLLLPGSYILITKKLF